MGRGKGWSSRIEENMRIKKIQGNVISMCCSGKKVDLKKIKLPAIN